MSLSNIFNEPRRELTESAIGILVSSAVIGGLGWLDYRFAQWYHDASGNPIHDGVILGFILFCFTSSALVIFVMTTHALGEAICNRLDQHDIRLRPKRPRLYRGIM